MKFKEIFDDVFNEEKENKNTYLNNILNCNIFCH